MPAKKPKSAAKGIPQKEKQPEYGVYGPHITAIQKGRLARMPLELNPEIHLLRALIDDCLGRMEACEDEEHQLKLFNAALAAIQRLLTAVRSLRSGSEAADAGPTDFQKALADFQEELGLKALE